MAHQTPGCRSHPHHPLSGSHQKLTNDRFGGAFQTSNPSAWPVYGLKNWPVILSKPGSCLEEYGPAEHGAALSDLCMFRELQGILDVYPQVPDGIFDLGVTQQNLDRAKIAGRLVDHCSLGAPKRMCAVVFAS